MTLGGLLPGSSPHTRGAPFRRLAALARVRDHPRIRGEHWTPPDGALPFAGSSPHTRGARSPGGARRICRRIIPAYAGSTRRAICGMHSRRDHPRIRGEHAQRHDPKGDFTGSSPHTRGARVVCHEMPLGPGIIPAYAGSTLSPFRRAGSCQDHPRIRGEHYTLASSFPPDGGSSPHTRGARRADPRQDSENRIIPAYAGSTTP